MKLKKGKLTWLIITILIILGYIGLSIYQLMNSDFDPLNLIMLIFMGDSVLNCFEKNDK